MDNEFTPRVDLDLIKESYYMIKNFIKNINQFNDMIDYYNFDDKQNIIEVFINNMFIKQIVSSNKLGHNNRGYNKQFNIPKIDQSLSKETYMQILKVHKWNKEYMKSKHIECLLCDIPENIESLNLRNMDSHEEELLKTTLTPEYIDAIVRVVNDNDILLIDTFGYVPGAYVFDKGFVECVTNPLYARETPPQYYEDFVHVAWYESPISAKSFYETANSVDKRNSISSLPFDEFIIYQNIENSNLKEAMGSMFKVYMKYRKFATMIVQESLRFESRPVSRLINDLNNLDISTRDNDNWF